MKNLYPVSTWGVFTCVLFYFVSTTQLYAQPDFLSICERVPEKAEKLISKSKHAKDKRSERLFEKALFQLRKCILKNPKCYSCHFSYIEAIYDKDSPLAVLYATNNALLELPNEESLLCIKFHILNRMFNLNLNNGRYQGALKVLEEIKTFEFNTINQCQDYRSGIISPDIKFRNEKEYKAYYLQEELQVYYRLFNQVLLYGNTDEALVILTQITSANLNPLGEGGVESKNWAFSNLYQIRYSSKNFLMARGIAQTLLDRGYKVDKSRSRICSCDSSLTLKYYNLRNFDKAYEYLKIWEHDNCSPINPLVRAKICLTLARDALENGIEDINSLSKAVDLVNQVTCSNVTLNYCEEIKELRKDIYWAYALRLVENEQFKDALHYLNSIHHDFRKDKAVLELKAKINLELGKALNKQGDLDLAIDFLRQVEDNLNLGSESSFRIAGIYEKAFRPDLALKQMDKVIYSNYLNNNLVSHAEISKARFFAMLGERDSAKKHLTSITKPNYNEIRNIAKFDPAFYNLRNDTRFNYWLRGERRFKLSHFTIHTNCNQDAVSCRSDLSFNKAPEYYFSLPHDNFERSHNTANKLKTSYLYSYQWPVTFKTFDICEGKSVDLTIETREHDMRFFGDRTDLLRKLSYTFSFYQPEQETIIDYFNYLDCDDRLHKFIISFDVTEDYNLDDVPVPAYYPSEPSIVEKVFFQFVECEINRTFKPVSLLVYYVAKGVLLDNEYENNEAGVRSAILNYIMSKSCDEEIYEVLLKTSYVFCILEAIGTLEQYDWNGEI